MQTLHSSASFYNTMADSTGREALFRSLVDQAPVGTCVFVGTDLVMEIANDTMLGYLGKDKSVLGSPLAILAPELVGQPFLAILDTVFHTGVAHAQKAALANIEVNGKLQTFYFDYTYKPLLDESGSVYAIMNVAVDVTAQVIAKQQLEEEKERANLAIDLTEIGVFEIDLITDVIYGDNRFNVIFGFDKTGDRKDYVSVFHPDDLDIRVRAHQELIDSGSYDYQARLIIKKQPVKWIRNKAKLILDDQNRPHKILGLVQDITQQKAYEDSLSKQVEERTAALLDARHSLEQSNQYLQTVLDNFETAFVALKPVYENGEITDFTFKKSNNAYSAYSFLSPGDLQDKLVSSVFPGYYQADAYSRYVETFITGRENVWELHYVADKLDVYLHLVARKMGDELIIQFTDFTKLKSLELELLKKIKELERSNRNLEEFAYAASHDLKEPIRKILFFSDLLRNSLNQRLSEKENHYFDRMDVAGKRMFSLIEDLLSFSQVNRQKPEPETADMNAVVRLVLEDLELEIAQQHATVLVDPLFTFKGYPRQLQQLFHNLIGNALKYSKPDVDPHITIAYTMTVGKDIPVQLSIEEQQQLFSVVTVTDNGIGFEQQNAERIFDVFTRLHGSDLVRGTGVGLAIVRKVMENHHGFVQANSELNIGTTFFLYFPLHG